MSDEDGKNPPKGEDSAPDLFADPPAGKTPGRHDFPEGHPLAEEGELPPDLEQLLTPEEPQAGAPEAELPPELEELLPGGAEGPQSAAPAPSQPPRSLWDDTSAPAATPATGAAPPAPQAPAAAGPEGGYEESAAEQPEQFETEPEQVEEDYPEEVEDDYYEEQPEYDERPEQAELPVAPGSEYGEDQMAQGGYDPEEGEGDYGGEPADEAGARRRFTFASYEEEEEEEDEPRFSKRTLLIAGGAVVVVLFAAGLGYLFLSGDEAPSEGEVALVEAPEGPAKVEPEDRGGLEVPDQDKLVFDRVSGDDSDLEEEMIEGPEEPLPLPEGAEDQFAAGLEAEPADDMAGAQGYEPAADEGGEADMAGRTEAPPPPQPESESFDDPLVQLPVQPAAEAVSEPAASTTSTRAATSGKFLVQIGSYRSAERAEMAWNDLRTKYGGTLAGLSMDVQRADLGARGIYYRLRGGPLDTREQANRVCNDLKAVGEGCLVVGR